MKYLFAILFGLAPLAAFSHPIHVSVCEVKHDPAAGRMEITIKIFADDFEDVLTDRKAVKINLGLADEHPDADAFIEEYIREKFKISIDERQRELIFERKEIEDIATWCYLAVDDVAAVSKVEVRNEVMLHWFKDQINVVHLDCNDKMNSTFLTHGRSEAVFEFK